MEAETASRYRSRILREMNANRNNPFNSPPSSTGSHGTVSPTLSSVFSDPEGESTRRLNEDIARLTNSKKLTVNWDAAHRKWPEFYGKPKARQVPAFDDDTDLRPMSSEYKENRPPAPAVKFADDSTQDIWRGSTRTRAEMQPRVDENESDISSIFAKSPARDISGRPHAKNFYSPSHLSQVHSRVQNTSSTKEQRRSSLTNAIDSLRQNASPRSREQQEHVSSRVSSAKSSLTAVPPSPGLEASPGHNTSHVRSFFMPDVSHLGDFVTGTLRFSGSVRNGVPIFVKNGKVIDKEEKPSSIAHAPIDGLEIPEDEEKIFVSMDMIRDEIVSLQEHYDKVQEYASNLQNQVEELEGQLRARGSNGRAGMERPNEQLMAQKTRLEIEVATLQSRLEQASRKISVNEIETESLTHERDRAVRKLQEACEDINKLTRKLSMREKELETSNKQAESAEQNRDDATTLRRDLISLKHTRDSLELENEALRTENETLQAEQKAFKEEAESLRRQHQSLVAENRSLRSDNKTLRDEAEELRDNLDVAQHELDAAREEVETLQNENEAISQEKAMLREDNDSLVRHNEKYFTENKVLRRENSGFERSMHELHDENQKLKDGVELLKQQLDHCRPIPNEDLSARLDEETEENMTSAFFIPDITMSRNKQTQPDSTETQPMPPPPELTTQTNQLSTIHDFTGERTKNTTQGDDSLQQQQKTAANTAAKGNGNAAQKVAFSIPGTSGRGNKSSSNLPNQGSKRQSSHSQQKRLESKRASVTGLDHFIHEDSTGVVSLDPTIDNKSGPVEQATEDDNRRQTRIEHSQSLKQRRTRSQSRTRSKHAVQSDVTIESYKSVNKDSCPALSIDARRVLDGLCEHKCQNCIVCCRITSHRGVVSSAEAASGKKRVTIPRPVPVTDRDLATDDPTMRPSQSPGHALALVIKGLEDEAHHMQLELSQLQSQYNSHDKSLGRRERLALAESIRTLLKRLEVKNDQIYSLYDVLEGQKAVGQAMSEEELELTVLNITGMTVRDVTSNSEQLTWEGIPDL